MEIHSVKRWRHFSQMDIRSHDDFLGRLTNSSQVHLQFVSLWEPTTWIHILQEVKKRFKVDLEELVLKSPFRSKAQNLLSSRESHQYQVASESHYRDLMPRCYINICKQRMKDGTY